MVRFPSKMVYKRVMGPRPGDLILEHPLWGSLCIEKTATALITCKKHG